MKYKTTCFEKRHAGKLTHIEISQRYAAGQSAAKIATVDGTTKTSILRILRKLKIKRRPSHGAATHGMTILARQFGVSPGTCYRYLALQKLGAKCVKCGETDPRVLAINHVDIKKHKILWSELAAIVAGKTLNVDVRCANCNVLYEHEKGLFPNHQKMIERLFGKS